MKGNCLLFLPNPAKNVEKIVSINFNLIILIKFIQLIL